MSKPTGVKPSKPSPDFPLFAHCNGKWAKKIKGKVRYFGRWDNPVMALREYNVFLREQQKQNTELRLEERSERNAAEEQAKRNRVYRQRSAAKAQLMTYLLSDGEYFKIGSTVAPAERTAKVQLGNARRIVIVAMALGDREKELHDMFAALHVRGEWFRADKAIVQWFVDNGLVNLQSKEFYDAYRAAEQAT